MRVVEAAMRGIGERQRIIADNIANAATPNFRARSVDFEASLASAVQTGNLSNARVTITDRDNPVKQDGNTVDATEEFMQMDQSALMYEALVQAMNFRVSSVKSALAR